MSVVISGRLHNRAHSGFVPTPSAHAEHIKANLLTFSLPAAGQHLTIYDPTCGEGDLLAPFATLRGAELYGVEISHDRAVIAQARLPNAHIIESDVAAISLPPAAFSLIVANPPYLQSDVTRVELAILKDAGEGLAPGGVLVAILPARQWDGFMAAHWLRHYDQVRCWKFPDHPDDPAHAEAFERFTQIVVVGLRRAAPRTEVDPAEKQRLRGWRYRAERLEAGGCPWDGGIAPPDLPDTPIAAPYRVPVVAGLPELVVRADDTAQILAALDASGIHTLPAWTAATTWPEETAVDRPIMDYTGAAHVAADILTGFLDGIPVTAPNGTPYLLTTFVTQEWVTHPLSDEDLAEERQHGTVAVTVEQLEDRAILGVLNLDTGAMRYLQNAAVYQFLTDGGWLPGLAVQCRARRVPWYQLDPADWQIRVACRIGQDKQLQGAELPGLSVAQQHRAYALYAAMGALGRAAIQGEPGTGKTRILTLLLAQAAERWQQRDSPAFRGQRQPAWLRRLKKAWKANPRTRGTAPRALPVLIAMPLRTRKGFRRDCAAAWPQAEFVVINDHHDIRRWLDRCAVSDAPAVIAIASLSQTRDFGNEWLPAAIERRQVCQVPDLSPEAEARGEPWLVDDVLVGYHDRESGALLTRRETVSRFFCPDCGQRVEDVPMNGQDDADASAPVTSVTYFIIKRRRCQQCGASLNTKDRIAVRRAKWPHVPFAVWSQGVTRLLQRDRVRFRSLTRRRIIDSAGNCGPCPPDSLCPYEYLATRYRGCVAITIVDESHNLAGRDSHLARAGHLAMRAAQARILSSGTHFAGTLDKLFFYWMRFNARFWQALGLGWNDLEAAVTRYGVIQHWVREVETAAKRGGRGQTEVRESTVPAPGVSARLLPRLLSELVFLTVLDVGAHMPPRVEIPEIVSMHDPALQEHVAAARGQVLAAEQQHAQAGATLVSLEAVPSPNTGAITTAQAAVSAAATQLQTAQAALADAQAWADARDLDRHYRTIAGFLEAKAASRDTGSSAARLAQGTIPRWFAALPCAQPPFTVTYCEKGDWGDVAAEHTLLTTPVLAWDYVYPLERRLREIVEAERAEGRRVMLYIEQQQRSMAQRLTWLLPEFEPWSLPERVAVEDREDAIRHAVQIGHTVVIVPFLRVAEGLNLQDVLDSIVWVELPKNLFTLDQASRRIWRLNKREPVRLYYLAYAGTAGHRKLRKLAAMSGAAALFAGQTPDGQLVRSVGAHTTTLARMSADLDAQDDLRAAFARRDAELAAALAAGRQWIGVADTLPERLRAIFQQVRASQAARPALPIAMLEETGPLVQVQMELAEPGRAGSVSPTVSVPTTPIFAQKPARSKQQSAAGQLTLFDL